MNKLLFYFVIIVVVFFPDILFSQTDSIAKDKEMQSKHKFEIQCIYSLQRPYYSITDITDIGLPKQYRYRSAFGFGIRYYVFTKWYSEFNTSFSQEGGGFKEQHTNANYLKNSINIGFSSKHSRKIIFDFNTGISQNILINAKFINTINGTKENISNYFNNTFISFPLSIGLKTKIADNTYITLATFLNMSLYKVSSESDIKVAQLIIPAFRISISKFLP